MTLIRVKAIGMFWFVVLASALVGCHSTSGRITKTIQLNHHSKLLFEDDKKLGAYRALIEQEVRRTLDVVASKWSIGRLSVRVFASQSNVIPEIGLNGYTPSATEIRLFFHPTFPSLEDSIRVHLFPLLAHEMHHARRTRLVGYGSTLLEAAVSEGLADHFSMEIAGGEPPIWSVHIQGEALKHWIDKASDVWLEPDYNHADWFLGTHPDIPRWMGYSMGFELVGRYLDAHPEQSASRLVGAPASEFAGD